MSESSPPVVVVGAGLAGLSTAMFLGLHGVPSLVVERHPGTSTQPKARGQFPNTMEALRVAGVAERVRKAGPAPDADFAISIVRSLTGPVIKTIMAEKGPDLSAFTPAGWGNTSQERAETVLAERAVELGAEIAFRTELVSFTQDAGGVTAVLRDLAGGTERTVRAGYLVAADGHRSPVRAALGIGRHGRGVLGDAVSALVEADLAAALPAELALIHVHNPELPTGSATLVSTDHPGRYAFAVGYRPGDAETAFSERHIVDLVRVAAGMPGLAVRVLDVGTTQTAALVADQFRAGRVLLAGDAAHVMPPTGGAGGNLAVLDGYQLGWKLAMVVRGQAGPALLDSHDAERRPYADWVVEQQYARMVERVAPHPRDGDVAEELPPEFALFGYRYPHGAVVREPDDDGAPFEDPAAPTGRPGSRAPHVGLATGSTIDLFGRGFVLLAGPSGAAWADAAAEAGRRLGIDVATHRIAAADAAGWCAAYGVGPGGASLVRPDGFVAWRSRGPGDPAAVEKALRTVLAR
ncbi:FAD-dependent monooxygenase [Gandjariella thermophila]|uniref:FAD-dependent oxidoreductase n=1 Tax=Gandjariella thermophila TaxID=1931992 RepID=A0A4D4J849_9PSEU|nr:FAD-dependent monooxygenase [Gandjariella thermophila]GDY30828.1 FAD-dependent oxidoreductase [Gandjariella thermophila]